MRKELGKIDSVSFGFDEYIFGLCITLVGPGWGCYTSKMYNPSYVEEEIRNQCAIDMLVFVQKILKDSKVDKVEDLKNKPIEATFEGNVLKEFRILTEVL